MSPLRSTRSSRKGRSNEESSGSKFSMESKLSVNKSERKRFHKKKSKPVNPEQEWYDWFGEIQQRIYPEEQNKEKIKNVRITDVLLDIERLALPHTSQEFRKNGNKNSILHKTLHAFHVPLLIFWMPVFVTHFLEQIVGYVKRKKTKFKNVFT